MKRGDLEINRWLFTILFDNVFSSCPCFLVDLVIIVGALDVN